MSGFRRANWIKPSAYGFYRVVVGTAEVAGVVVGGLVVVVGGRVVVVEGTNVAVGFGFTASLNPNTRLMITAAIMGAVTIRLLVSVASAISTLQKHL